MIIENWIPLSLLLAGLLSASAYFAFRKKKAAPAPAPAPAVEAAPVEVAAPVAVAAQRATLQSALAPTRSGWVSRLSQLLSRKGADKDAAFEEMEATLYAADIGVKTSAKLLELVKGDDASLPRVKDAILGMLTAQSAAPIVKNGTQGPKVIMFVGVNGVGKTTSIGKLASQLASQGNSVVLGAGDTFRAAAAEQLDIWAQRSGASIVRGKEEADPASVLFDAVAQAKAEHKDFVLCDTAGRLHTKTNLMDELKKVHKVLGKAAEGAPHEVLLVVDATTGQNAIEQARQFSLAAPLSGVVLTKLDGSAKGGVVIGIADELKIPIRYIGVGEGVADLRPFDAQEFVKALFNEAPEGNDHVL